MELRCCGYLGGFSRSGGAALSNGYASLFTCQSVSCENLGAFYGNRYLHHFA